MPVLHAISSSLFVKHTFQLDTVSPTRRLHLIVVYIQEPRLTVLSHLSYDDATMYLWVLIVHT